VPAAPSPADRERRSRRRLRGREPRHHGDRVDAGDADAPQVFARNTLQIAVPATVPTSAWPTSPTRSARSRCAPPRSRAAPRAPRPSRRGRHAAPDTLEQDVKAALAKVRLGEVDAALVYRTDVLAAGDDVRGIDFPEAAGAVNDYPSPA
jgi:molybdate transport system substrate-binding protein